MEWLNKKLTIKRIFLIGLLIRILVMPFFGHDDIFAVHRRVGNIVCGENTIFNHSDFGVHAIESVASILTLPIIPCENLMEIQRSNIEVTNLNRMLFFFKLPYLIFEIGFWYLMWNLLKSKDKVKNRRIAMFLAFNPVIIYAAYLFGRYEPYAMFFIATILYTIQKYRNETIKSAIIASSILALIFTVRLSYFFIFPALVLAFGGINKKGLLVLISTLGFFTLFKQIPKIFGPQTSSLPEVDWISTGAHTSYIFQANIRTGANHIYLFIFLIAIYIFWWLEKQEVFKKLNINVIFSIFSVLILLSYYATSNFHPQYLAWVLPFLLVLIVNDKNGMLWKLFKYFLPFFLIYIFLWGRDLSFGLAAPLSIVIPHLYPLEHFPVFQFSTWANIFRSVFSGFCLYIIFYVIRVYGKAK